MSWRTLFQIVTVLGLLALLVIAFQEAGSFTGPLSTVAQIYARRTVSEIGATNVVAAVTFDWRGFDTFAEATLVLAAATGVKAILRRWLQRRRETGVA